jgi:hypothetical protein
MFQRTGTITTFFASRREPEVDFSVVSTLLPPLPPPSRPNASRRWIFLAFRRHHLLQGVFFPRHQHRGGVKPIHRRVRMFSLPFVAPGAAYNFAALFATPDNNEEWPPCGVDDRVACRPFSTLRGPLLTHKLFYYCYSE